ncbi:MAG TPA: RNA methyltransferase [Vicinamibacterales bacterium]
MEHVTSRNNPLVKQFRAAARDGRADDLVLLDGEHLVSEAMDSGVTLAVVALSAETADRRFAALAERAARSGTRVVTMPERVLSAVSPVRQPSGIVALANVEAASLEAAVAARPPQLVVLLDRVQDPGNVGAIIRTAEACGATAAIAGPGTADPFGWKALRGSMGSALRLPVARVQRVDDAVHAMRAAGLRIFTTRPRGGTAPAAADLTGPAAVVVGGEGAGLSHDLIAAADESLTIDMHGPVESLNVSVAAAIILYEASRQRAHVAVR